MTVGFSVNPVVMVKQIVILGVKPTMYKVEL